MFYLLHGNDEFTCREQLKKLRRQGSFDYNQDTYYGGEVSLMTLTATCNTIPFLAEQRLVVLEGLPKRRRGEGTGFSSEIETETPEKSGKSKKSKKGSKAAQNRARALKRALPRTFPTCRKVRCWLYWSMKNSLPATRCSKPQKSTVRDRKSTR